ncbi:MAG: cobyric acid synthase [Chloroflexi bacterium]|nr:cobyric acid synthase [Chloroflexota bacterium]
MTANVLMVQGTASSVGKSLLVAALCRLFRQEGYRVAPFKAQNMALNAFVTCGGGEMGRAQAVQAEAASIDPTVDMNPILLKPEADAHSQVIVLGRVLRRVAAREYYTLRDELWPVVTGALDRLRRVYDIVVIEGAGSPAEVNLRRHEMVNMAVARYAQAPVLLVGDIDRGGVFAALVGTLELLEPDDRALVKGLVINRFRGDASLLGDGLRFLEARTGLPALGVVPYVRGLHIAEEDSVALEERLPTNLGGAAIDIAIVRLPRIANFDDFSPLEREGARVRYVESPVELRQPDMLVLPGTKTTMEDLAFLRRSGLADAITALARAGTYVLGICGGFQMLGREVRDPDHVEAAQERAEGLGLLPVVTTFVGEKVTRQVQGRVAAAAGLLTLAEGAPFRGYEIHMGRTEKTARPESFGRLRTGPVEGLAPFVITERGGEPCHAPDGAADASGHVVGTYVHGLFESAPLRQAVLRHLAARKGVAYAPAAASREADYDRIADVVRGSLDMGLLHRIAGLEARSGRGR